MARFRVSHDDAGILRVTFGAPSAPKREVVSTDDHWIATRITEAKRDHSLVTEAALSRIAAALEGQLSEQQLSPRELASFARELIADMAPTPPKPDAKQ